MTLKTIREGKFSKIVASYLAIQLFLQMAQPMQLFALTSGPSQPEFNSFTPIGTSDMVSLSSGDFNYNIPLADVGGYPINLSYSPGAKMDQEASWVGLGWDLNIGQIARDVRGIPDDFKGDEMRYENDIKETVTIGSTFSASLPALFGVDFLKGNVGLNVQYNNYEGITMQPTYGVSYELAKKNSPLAASLGLQMSSGTGSGANVGPSFGISKRGKENEDRSVYKINTNAGVSFNSRQGLSNFNLSTSKERLDKVSVNLGFWTGYQNVDVGEVSSFSGAVSTSFSFNDQINFTPNTRVGNESDNFTFNTSIGPSIIGGQIQGQFTGYGSYQRIRNSEKNKMVVAFGYDNTEVAEGSKNAILDFTREKDGGFNKFTTALPVTNYSYDTYVIQGQGVGGMFRPFRSQVSYVYDNEVKDASRGGTLGFEGGGPPDAYIGGEIKINKSKSTTGKWLKRNFALPKFEEGAEDPNPIEYEKVYFKGVGELDVDPQISIYNDDVYSDKPIRLDIAGDGFNKSLSPAFKIKNVNTDGTVSYTSESIPTTIKRNQRYTRNQSIYKVSNRDAEFDPQVLYRAEDYAKSHHTVGVKVLNPSGSTYIFGESAYNTKKIEATFDVSSRSGQADCTTGLVPYNGTVRNNNSNSSNQYLNRITTPAYAHSYALSAVISSDYEDILGDGFTDDDLGSYTKFSYQTIDDYKWRFPFQENMASYNEGLKSNDHDETANYLYGEKELKYVTKIETKTHVAVLDLSDRMDAIGVKGEHGGSDASSGKMQKIDKIYLFTKPEYQQIEANFENTSYEERAKRAIKIVHFDYVGYDDNGNYSPDAEELCKNVPNNVANQGGKLTLEKVYFTYRGSFMGKYTPYVFHYGELESNELAYDNDGNTNGKFNPDYNAKSYDVWGNYMENRATNCDVDAPLTPQEFPFVQQEDKELQDVYTKAWCLTSIDLPSGGKMKVELESDVYGYVQDRNAMQMFKVVGAGDSQSPSNPNTPFLYDGNDHSKFIYVKIKETETPDVASVESELIADYIGDLEDETIYFRFLMNMFGEGILGQPDSYSEKSDYVTGYVTLDGTIKAFSDNNGTYLALPLRELEREGGLTGSNKMVNPITKAGWHFGRTYLNRVVYSSTGEPNVNNLGGVIIELFDSFAAIYEIFTGPNKALQDENCSREFIPEKSWVRLKNPGQQKLGGGRRVKQILLFDRWDTMIDSDATYGQHYGQDYDYTLANGKTSGVASYEPNSSKENPFVEPFYDKEGTKYADRLASPREENYTEKPLGETFFPSAMVTYGRVTVKNIERKELNSANQVSREVKKHATGKVVNEFYTCKDFPTIADFTDINTNGLTESPKVAGLLNLSVRNHLVLSQGFVVVTNDMNGKMKSSRVFAEGQSDAISGVDYIYNIDPDKTNQLNNVFTTINSNGRIQRDIIGQHYDIVNDFRESRDLSDTGGVNANLTTIFSFLLPTPVFVPLPNYARHENLLRTAATTKVIHKSGILVEKIAYDLGARVSTKNLAWDAHTGQTLLTETINEYDDNYYNFTYPAHWAYSGLDKASNNLGITGDLIPNSDPYFNIRNTTTGTNENNVSRFVNRGDEILLYKKVNESIQNYAGNYWVIDISDNNREIMLIDRNGSILNPCGDDTDEYVFSIVRSAHKNQQMAAMASVTSIKNPILDSSGAPINQLDVNLFKVSNGTTGINEAKIVNASAVEYSDFWKPQVEYDIPVYLSDQHLDAEGFPEVPESVGINPFLYNIKGEWRAVKSYAYLTSRNANLLADEASSPRYEGFFKEFNPFYELSGGVWSGNPEGWTFASEVSQYNSYGPEVENRDALDRYSSAQYGYNYHLPVAVASNSRYRQMGYDGFEDYSYFDVDVDGKLNPHFSFIDEVSTGTGFRTATTSHTGRYSLQVPNGQSIELSQFLTSETVDPSGLANCADVDVSDDPDGCDAIKSRTLTITGGIPFAEQTYYFSYRAGTDACWTDGPNYTLAENGGVPQDIQDSGTFNLDANGNGTFTFTAEFQGGFYGRANPNIGISESDIIVNLNYTLGEFQDNPGDGLNLFASVDFGCFFNDANPNPDNNDNGCVSYGTGLGNTIGNPPNGGGSGTDGPRYSSFKPLIQAKGKLQKYIISAWIKEDHAQQQITYQNSRIVLKGDNDVEITSFSPDGVIIEGWQRVTGIFEIPENTNVFTIGLENLGLGSTAFFDDLRIHPLNSNLKSFVYDPETLRLEGELDENNFATFYEYDREGGLIRVKKETERGVFTIQETRSGNSKLNGL